MSTTDAHGLEYAYCVAPATFSLANAPDGLDNLPIRLITHDGLSALTTTLDATEYSPSNLEQLLTNMEWLKPRAVAHDRVVTWASDHAPIVPLPMWTLFSDPSAVETALHTQHETLQTTLTLVQDAREYTIRVFADVATLTAAAVQLSPTLAELEHRITSASPGQAYLIRRKLDADRKTEIRTIARQIADDTYTTLSTHAKQSVRDPLAQGDNDNNAILNASFLVPNDQYPAFRHTLTTLITQYEPSGLHFDFTGPWPAHHFTRVS